MEEGIIKKELDKIGVFWIGVGMLIFSFIVFIAAVLRYDFHEYSIIVMSAYILVSASIIISDIPSVSSSKQFMSSLLGVVISISIFFINNWFISIEGNEGHLNPICSIGIIILAIICFAHNIDKK